MKQKMAESLKVLIVDDEYHARKLLSEYVSKIPFLELVGMQANAFDAIDILRKEEIDILLSDIQMPEITGLEFARSLKNPPAIIFTTAYSEYAVESYELDVVDYLLKPIAFPRFFQAINKVIERRGTYKSDRQINNVNNNAEQTLPEKTEPETDTMVIKSGHKFYKINYSALLYIEGQREYVTFHTVDQRITTLYSLKELEESLPSNMFIRIHKSYIVSIRNIRLIDKNILHIVDKRLPIGGNYRERLMLMYMK